MLPVFSRLKPKPLVALDIHPEEIFLLQLQKSTSLSIKTLSTQPLPAGAIVDGTIKQPEIVKAVIRSLVNTSKVKGSCVAIALPTHHVICKQIQLPFVLQPHEWHVEVRSRLERYLPEVTEDVCLDFVELSQAGDHRNILLIAARQEQLLHYIEVVNQSHLKVKYVEIDAYALTRAVKRFLPEKFTEKRIVIIEIRHANAILIVYQNMHVIFSQQISFESYIQLAEALKRVLNFYLSVYQVKPEHYFLNDNVLSSAMEVYLREQLQVRIQKLNFFSQINSVPQEHRYCSMLTSVGLALRGRSSVRN